MHQHIKFVLSAALLLCSSCVPSVNPIFSDKDTVFDQSIVGKWGDLESSETWEFSSTNQKEYKLVHKDEAGKTGTFTARLTDLNGKRFLDIVPDRRARTATDFYEDRFIETHTFVLVEKRDKTFLISYLEPKWLKDHLANNPDAVKHLIVNGEVLLTDSTENLRKFLSEAVGIKGAFSEPSQVRRIASS